MPLYNGKPFPLSERPKDMKLHDLVFQVRFTKEIFRDYEQYLNRINLYRQRVWTCKITGKTNLTYEEALVSERRVTEKAHKFPKDLVATVLSHVQFSMLTLKDLVNFIAAKFQEPLLEGSELHGRKNNRIYPCRIMRVLEDTNKTEYEVAWLDKDKNITENAVVNGEDLIRKKLPFTRDVLKSFIRESTHRTSPWVLHENLARKHGISIDLPEVLKGQIFLKDGLVIRNRKRKKSEDQQNTMGELKARKRKKPWTESEQNAKKENDKPKEQPIKYPIDDLLVQPAADDPVFTEHPFPSMDFNVPMNCVGDLLMVWDFCSSFGRLLHLSPFSLEDFEKALRHKDSTPVLIVESYSALLGLLIKDEGEYFMVIQEKSRKPKITLITWTDFLCDFLEMSGTAELSTYISTIKRGHYGLLDIKAKLGIFQELVYQVLSTDLVREKLDEYIEERHALAATRREEAIKQARKKREEKERLKLEPNKNEVIGNGHEQSVGWNSGELITENQSEDSKDVARKQNETPFSQQRHSFESSKSKQIESTLKKKKRKGETEVKLESVEDSFRKRSRTVLKGDNKEVLDKRKEFLEWEMEKRFIRTNPLGKDRYYNRYWFFRHDGRIFVESSNSSQWGYYSSKEEFDAFMGSLNLKGERERALRKQLIKYYNKICSWVQKRSKDLDSKIAVEEAVLRRSTRVRAPPRDNPANAFFKYVNKWKED